MTEKKPKILQMDENGKMVELAWDSIPDPVNEAYDLKHHFLPVKISPKAIDMASKIVPEVYITKHGGVHSFLTKRANEVFQTLSASQRSGTKGQLKYIFDFDKDGPVLKMVARI